MSRFFMPCVGFMAKHYPPPHTHTYSLDSALAFLEVKKKITVEMSWMRLRRMLQHNR